MGHVAACSGFPLAGRAVPVEGPGLVPDPARPFVQNGDGQPKGLSVREQVEWMKQATHPLDYSNITVDDDLAAAVKFEIENTPEFIDSVRLNVLDHWIARAQALEGEHMEWIAGAPLQTRTLISKLHGPLIQEMCDAMHYEDASLVQHLQMGFP